MSLHFYKNIWPSHFSWRGWRIYHSSPDPRACRLDFENCWSRQHLMELKLNCLESPCFCETDSVKLAYFPIFSEFKITRLFLLQLFWKIKCFPSLFPKKTVFFTFAICFFFLYSELAVAVAHRRLLPCLFLSQDSPPTEKLCLMYSSSPGQWLAMTWSLLCKSSLNGMRLRLSNSWNCKVSPVSQPIMTPSEAVAGPLVYFEPRPLLYLARLWESTV